MNCLIRLILTLSIAVIPIAGHADGNSSRGIVMPSSGAPRAATIVSPRGTANTTPTYTWNAVPGATDYYLWVNDSVTAGKIKTWYPAAQAGCAAGTGACSVTPATALAAGAGKWWIQTRNSAEKGPWSAGTHFSVSVIAPGAPAISLPIPGDDWVMLSWSAPGTGDSATSYNIYYIAGAATVTTATATGKISGVDSTSLSYTVKGLANATQYAFMVTAVNAGGESPASTVVTANLNPFWSEKASLANQRDNLAVAVVNGRIYAIGGAPAGFGVLSSVEEYDPAFDIWTTKAPMGNVRYGPSAAVVNGLIYAIGGTTAVDGSDPITAMEVYNPATNTWSNNVPGTGNALAHIPTGRWGFDTAVIDGVIYVIGGSVRGTRTPMNTQTITPSVQGQTYTMQAIPTPKGVVNVSSVVVKAGGVVKAKNIDYAVTVDATNSIISITIVSGGTIIDGSSVAVDYTWQSDTYYGTVEAYDPAANSWTTKAPMPTPRYGMTVSVVNGLIYAIGGWGGWPELSTVEVYNPVTNVWSATVASPSGCTLDIATAGGEITEATVADGGTGYAVGQELLVQAGDSNGIVKIATVGASGVVLTVTPLPPVLPATKNGTGYSDALGVSTLTMQAHMPTERDDFGYAVVNGMIYAMGGDITGAGVTPGGIYNGTCCTDIMEAYDTATNTWSAKTPMPKPVGLQPTSSRDDFDSVTVDGVIYAIAGSLDGLPGGLTQGGTSYTTVQAYAVSNIATPRLVTVTAAGAGQVSLSWAHPVTGAAPSYNIYWSTKPGITTAGGTRISGAASGSAITGLTSGQWCYFAVTAVTAAGESLPSNEAAIKMP